MCSDCISDDCRLQVVMMSILVIDDMVVVVVGVEKMGGSNVAGGATPLSLVGLWPFSDWMR